MKTEQATGDGNGGRYLRRNVEVNLKQLFIYNKADEGPGT